LFFATWTQNRTLSARDPPKEPAASCYPETYKYDVPIVRGNTGQATPTPTPSGTPQPTVLPPTGGFTPSVDIRYNPSTGKVESDVQEITLQADSIYPRDSVPLRITDDAPCAIESRLEAKQPDCFSLSRTSLTFQSNEYAGGCPAKVKGNQLDVPQGDAYLVLGAICSPTSQIRIPIRVNAQSATSITAAPRQLDEGEGTAKLLYVINQKQSGARTLTPLGASGTVAVGAHSASVFSWSGPGTLSLLDGDVDVGEWTYQNAPAYFEGVGSMGPRVDSASDYLGCSQGWCSGQAALQALRAFQQAAKDTAAATMFRRGSSTNLPPAQPTPVPTTIPSATPTPSATASASPSASPSPSASATASATPSPSPSASAQASSTSVSMKENDVRTAANGNKIKLTEILDAGGTTYAAFSVLSSSGADLDAPSLLVGESYNKNGIQFQVTSIDPSSAGNQRAVHVTLTGSWQLAASSVIGLDGLQASSETSFSPRALSFATVAGEPFVFSTVMQLTEGADKAFDILGVQRTGSGCGGLPGVYLVTASSTDGSTFAYSAQALRLQQSLDGTKPDLLLCGFMHASKKQVVALKNPSLPSQLQASEEHAKPQTKLAIFTLAPVYKQQCEALGNQVVTLQKKIDAEKADLRQAANLLQAAVTQLDAGIKVAFAAEAGSKGAKSFSEANAKVAPYVCTKAGCTPCAIRGCAPGYADATGPNGQALAAHGSARLNLFNAKTALSEALAKANLPDEATSSAVPSPVAASTGPATQAAEKLNKEFTTDIGAVETSRQSAVEALQAAKPPATDKGSGAAVGAAAKSSGLATTAQTKTAAALTLAKGAAQAVTTVRLQYDKDVQQLTATKQKCNAMRPPLFEIPFGLWPQQSQFACPTSDRYAAEAARLEAEKLATQNALDVATKSGADFGADLDTKIADAKALAAKGCVALCKPKPACIESYPMGRQFTQVIHLGLSEDCMPYSKNAAGDLAKSFLVSKVMSSLGPYAMLASFSTGGACSGAQGYFTTDNLGGQGGGYSGGNVGGGGFIG